MAEHQSSIHMDVHVNGFHQSPVSKAFDALSEAVTQLQDEWSRMNERVGTALGPELPMDPGHDSEMKPAKPSEIVIALERETSRILHLVREINHTTNRVEL